MSKDINFFIGNVKCDSVCLSIPLSNCEIINSDLVDLINHTITNTNTGEVIKDVSKFGEPVIITNPDGTYLKFWKSIQFDYVQGKKVPNVYISFLTNSKHLTVDYFNGITLSTLEKVRQYILSYKIVSFDYQTLYDARYSDTDICFDFISTKDGFNSIKKALKERSIKSNLWHTSPDVNNSGIWTPSKREPRKQGTPSNPYVKFYSKEEDFIHKSKDFAQAYFQPSDYINKYRCEVTIHNKEHRRRLGIDKISKFGDFLNLDLQLILSKVVKEYFEITKVIPKTNDLKPMELVVIDLMNELVKLGIDNQKLYSFFDRNDTSRQSKQVLIEKYHKLTQLDNFNKKQLEINSQTDDLFKFLGIG